MTGTAQSLVGRVFRRSRVVNTWGDVMREFRLWAIHATITVILAGVLVVTAWSNLALAVPLGLLILVVGYVAGPLSYVLAPILLLFGGEFVLMDRSFGIWGWVIREAEGDTT